MSEDQKQKNKATKDPNRTPYHVNKCALSRVLKGEAIVAFNEAPKDSDYESEETMRYKTPTQEVLEQNM